MRFALSHIDEERIALQAKRFDFLYDSHLKLRPSAFDPSYIVRDRYAQKFYSLLMDELCQNLAYGVQEIVV